MAIRVWLCGLMLAFTSFSGNAEQVGEDAVKAAFLYRFAGYVEWPEKALAGPQFTIAVLGSSAVAEELTKLAAKRSTQSRVVRIRLIETPAQVEDAQVLYVSNEYSGDVRAAVRAMKSKPVLVVTDHPNGLDIGGAVNFMVVDRRVRFEVSLPAAQRAGLRISSELLSVATRVRGALITPDALCSADDGMPGRAKECVVRMASL